MKKEGGGSLLFPVHEARPRKLTRIGLSEKGQQAKIDRAIDFISSHPSVVLDRQKLETYKPYIGVDAFANPAMATNSLHDIRHGAEFLVMGEYVTSVVETEYPGVVVNHCVVRRGVAHDTRRHSDLFESIFALERHGRNMSAKVDTVFASDGGTERENRETAAIMAIHDRKRTPENLVTPTSEVFIGTDRILLGRLIYNAPRNLLDIKGGIIWIANIAFRNRRSKYHTQHFDLSQFTDVADALYFLSVKEINRRVKAGEKYPDQFDAVMDAAAHLGMFGKTEEQVAQVASASSRRLASPTS